MTMKKVYLLDNYRTGEYKVFLSLKKLKEYVYMLLVELQNKGVEVDWQDFAHGLVTELPYLDEEFYVHECELDEEEADNE